MKKRNFLIALAASMLLLSACSGGNEQPTDSGDATTASSSPTTASSNPSSSNQTSSSEAIVPTAIAIPTLRNKTLGNNNLNVVYNRSEFEVELAGDNLDKITVSPSAVFKATNVGVYNVSFSLSDTVHYCWEGSEESEITLTWRISKGNLEDFAHEVFFKIDNERVEFTGDSHELPAHQGDPMDVKLYVIYNDGDEPVELPAVITADELDTNIAVSENKLVVNTGGTHAFNIAINNDNASFSKNASVGFTVPARRALKIKAGDTSIADNYGDSFTAYTLASEQSYCVQFGSATGFRINGNFRSILRVTLVFSSYGTMYEIKAYASKEPSSYIGASGDVENDKPFVDGYSNPLYEVGQDVIFGFETMQAQFDPLESYTLKFWSWADDNVNKANVTSMTIEYTSDLA